MGGKPRVALVFPHRIRRDSFFGFLLPSMGLERIGAEIEDVADVELFDGRFEKDLPGEIRRFDPDFVGINCKTTVYSGDSYRLAHALREVTPKAKLVLGGLHATSVPFEALGHADYVIRGDGEMSMKLLIQGAELATISGLVYREADGPTENNLARPEKSLDEFKPPARHLRKPHYCYSAAGLIKMDLLETARGCTHICTFCSPASVYPASYRTHSPEYVMEEIRRLDEQGVKYCMLTDDHLGGNLDRVEKISDLILESGIRIAFFSFIRPFEGRMDLKRKMTRAGFVLMSYGSESPNPEQQKRYKKGFPGEGREFIRTVNAQWHEAGAKYIGNSYVFGDPHDSEETLANLGPYARRLDPTFIEPLYSQPFPGTAYRKGLEAEGKLLPGKDWSDFTEARMLVKHPDVDEEQLRRLRAKMWLEFFSPRKAAGVFRVPLYFHHHLGLSAITVLRYMHACDYAVFGCILEDKIYQDLQVGMVKEYFRDKIPTFEPEEMEVTENFDAFTDMLGLGVIKRLAGHGDLWVKVVDGLHTCASLVLTLEEGQIVRGVVVEGEPERVRRTLSLPLSLDLLAQFLGTTSRIEKILAFLGLAGNLLLLDVPRKTLRWLNGWRRSLREAT